MKMSSALDDSGREGGHRRLVRDARKPEAQRGSATRGAPGRVGLRFELGTEAEGAERS